MNNLLNFYKILKILFQSFILLFFAGSVWAADISEQVQEVSWQSWSGSVFEQAKTENKLVLLDLTAEWCEFCKKMDATTYRDPRILALLKQDYIAVRVDEKDSPELAKRYEKAGRPATIIFNSQGTEIIRKRGYIKPQWMLWFLQAVVANPTVEAHKVAQK